jgi:nucleoside-diphosphate-sugar epimerase
MGHGIGPILVTGASGYLGTVILDLLKQYHLRYIGVSSSGKSGVLCDLTDPEQVKKIIEEIRPITIIHCAAEVPKNSTEYANDSAAKRSIAMIKNIADNSPSRIIFASSMTIYVNTNSLQVVEEETIPPDNGYAKGKWDAEEILFRHNVPGDITLRLPGLFGMPKRTGLIYNTAKSLLTDGTFTFTPSPDIWATIHVQDAAEYFIRAVTKPTNLPPTAINIGYPGAFTMSSTITKIAEICGISWKINASNEKPFSMNLDKVESLLGTVNSSYEQRLMELVNEIRKETGNNLT